MSLPLYSLRLGSQKQSQEEEMGRRWGSGSMKGRRRSGRRDPSRGGLPSKDVISGKRGIWAHSHGKWRPVSHPQSCWGSDSPTPVDIGRGPWSPEVSLPTMRRRCWPLRVKAHRGQVKGSQGIRWTPPPPTSRGPLIVIQETRSWKGF